MAPYQLILSLLHSHGLPESRLTEAYDLILSRLKPGHETWFTTPSDEVTTRRLGQALLALKGGDPKAKAMRERLLLDTFTRAYQGDKAQARLTLSSLLTTLSLN